MVRNRTQRLAAKFGDRAAFLTFIAPREIRFLAAIGAIGPKKAVDLLRIFFQSATNLLRLLEFFPKTKTFLKL